MISAMPAVHLRRERKKSQMGRASGRGNDGGNSSTGGSSRQGSIKSFDRRFSQRDHAGPSMGGGGGLELSRVVSELTRINSEKDPYGNSNRSSGRGHFEIDTEEVRCQSFADYELKRRMKYIMFCGTVCLTTGLITLFIGVGLSNGTIQKIGLAFIGLGVVLCLFKVLLSEKRNESLSRGSGSIKSGSTTRSASHRNTDHHTIQVTPLTSTRTVDTEAHIYPRGSSTGSIKESPIDHGRRISHFPVNTDASLTQAIPPAPPAVPSHRMSSSFHDFQGRSSNGSLDPYMEQDMSHLNPNGTNGLNSPSGDRNGSSYHPVLHGVHSADGRITHSTGDPINTMDSIGPTHDFRRSASYRATPSHQNPMSLTHGHMHHGHRSASIFVPASSGSGSVYRTSNITQNPMQNTPYGTMMPGEAPDMPTLYVYDQND